MTCYNVVLYQAACLETTVEVEADSPAAARAEVLGWSEAGREECFEGEQFHPIGDVELVSVEDAGYREVS